MKQQWCFRTVVHSKNNQNYPGVCKLQSDVTLIKIPGHYSVICWLLCSKEMSTPAAKKPASPLVDSPVPASPSSTPYIPMCSNCVYYLGPCIHTRCPAPCHFINPQLLRSVKSLLRFSGVPAQWRAAFGCTCAVCLPPLHPARSEKVPVICSNQETSQDTISYFT